MEWKRISDKPPSKWGYYLTCSEMCTYLSKKAGYSISRFNPKNKSWYTLGSDEPITHWHPLPEPPKEVFCYGMDRSSI